jgi:hypothetical protein
MSATNLEIAREIWTDKDGQPFHKVPYDASKVAIIAYNRLARYSYWKEGYGVVDPNSAEAAELRRFIEAIHADPWPYVGNEYSFELLPYTAESAETWSREQDRIPYSAKRPRRRRA